MYRISDIAAVMGATVEGNPDCLVRTPCTPPEATVDDLALAMDPRFVPLLANSKARSAVVPQGTDWVSLGLLSVIIVDRPRLAMAHLTQGFAPKSALSGIHASAIIDPTAAVAPDAVIGPFVTIAAGAQIGVGARILSHASIGQNVRTGAHIQIGEGARVLADVTLGNNVLIHANAVIGSDGFSFVTPKPGSVDAFKSGEHTASDPEIQDYVRIHSLASVTIGDDVEVGAGSTIDSGTISDTIIGRGTKIDNLVQIGHNVKVGEACLICGQVGIAGSAKIGNQVVLAGQAGVADHVSIGDHVIAAGKSGISSNVPANRVMMGNPAIPMAANIESYKAIRRLPRFMSRLQALEKQVSKFTSKL